MELSITKDVLPGLLWVLAWAMALGGTIAAVALLLYGDPGDDAGKVFLVSVAIALCGGILLFFLYGGRVIM